MSETGFFQCRKCKKVIKKDESPNGDEMTCCGETMIEMPDPPSCESSATAEQYRLFDADDPCDDGIH